MRRAGEIMEELGFKKDAPEGVQKAFIKNLVRAAYGAEVKDLDEYRKQHREHTEKKTSSTKAKKELVVPGPNQEEQLSFDLKIHG